MQTIKIYLKESGSVAELVKDFNLYAGSYQNKLLDVYVPTSILYTATDIDSAVKIGGLLIAPNGSQVTTKSYYLNFVRNEVVFDEFAQKNIEYAVYERLLPKEFTLFSGNQSIVTNVVAIDNTDAEKSVIKQVVTTQTATLVVQESAYLDEEETIEPSELETISSKVSENSRDIVDLQGRMTTTETNIMTNAQEISKNAQEIADIKEQYTQPEDYVGQMVGTILPTQKQLTQYVIDTEDRQPKNADVVIFILQIEGETDKNYKYIYSTSGWNGYQIPSIENAKNGELGLIEGTFNIGSTNNTIVDIVGGQIINIYVKDNNNTYRNIQEYSNSLKSDIEKITNGTTRVGTSLKAEQDGNGNNIINTYLNKNDGATKDYVKDYSLPRQFNDVSYITNNGYSSTIGDALVSTPINYVGSAELLDITKEAGAKYQISNKNVYDNIFYLKSNKDCTVGFRLTTKIKGQRANVEFKEYVVLEADKITKISFHDNFDLLGDTVLNLEETDTIQQILEVVTYTSESLRFTYYSNSTYPSKFYLNTQSMILKSISGRLGEQITLWCDGYASEEDEKYNFVIGQTENFIPYKYNGTEFLVTLYLSTPREFNLDETKYITITAGDTTYYVYNLAKSLTEPATIGDLKQVKVPLGYSTFETSDYHRWMCKMTYLDEVNGFALIPSVSGTDEVVGDINTALEAILGV